MSVDTSTMQTTSCTTTLHVCTFVHEFTGKERDAESGLDYFGARYYGSSMGRMMSPDWSARAEPVPYAKMDNPQSLNLYVYVGNNPLSRIDANGHCYQGGDGNAVCGGISPNTGTPIIGAGQSGGRPQTSDSITVNGRGGHWWNKVGSWFGGTVSSAGIAFARFGRLGGPAHRQAVGAASRLLEEEGFTVTQEKYIRTPNGAKSGRFIDVYGEKSTSEGVQVRAFQIGRTNADNITPVSREVSALNDIEGATGMRPQFLDYQSPYPLGEVPLAGWPVQPPSPFGLMPGEIAPEEDIIP